MLGASCIEIKDTIIAVTLQCRVKNPQVITVDYYFCTTSNVYGQHCVGFHFPLNLPVFSSAVIPPVLYFI